ncbi:MAG: glycosyltransferase family 1 protein [Patescibacteria group bacterium]
MKNITFITDAGTDNNISGVVTWLLNTKRELEKKDYKITLIEPKQFTNFPLPSYPEIKIALLSRNAMESMIAESKPDFIHIATEGPLGLVARAACQKNSWKFTTFYHTRLPEYLHVRFRTFKGITYQYMRWFHQASACTMVSTNSLKKELEERSFERVALVPMGVDIELFQRNQSAVKPDNLQKPIFTYLGRVAPEKNIEAFLECSLPGSKLIIGDGPAREALELKYKHNAIFVGYKKGQEIIDLLSISDVFVFPSKTDTFGLTIIEALACGLPTAAYDVQGPNDIIENGVDGYLGENLEENAKKCLTIDSTMCTKKAKKYSWTHSAESFLEHLAGIN